LASVYSKGADVKVIVCGSSRFQDKRHLFEVLDALHAQTPIMSIINGGARGADLLASQWASERAVPLIRYRAAVGLAGRRQAFIELNAQMLCEQRPDLIVAFPGGEVSADLIAQAQAAGINVLHVR
jgi:hypothetical protein